MPTSQEALKLLQKGMAHLKSITHPDPESIADVAVEATSHIIEHFVLKPGPEYAHDFCLILYNGYLGPHKEVLNQGVHATGIYKVGLNELMAYQLADLMKVDSNLRELLIDAVRKYHYQSRPPGNG